MKTTLLILLLIEMHSQYFETRAVAYCASHISDTCKTVERKFTARQKNSILSGLIVDCETHKPLKLGVLSVSGDVFYTDSLGRFQKILKPGKYLVKAGWPSYQLETIKIHLRLKDSLNITFYLKTDEQPLR